MKKPLFCTLLFIVLTSYLYAGEFYMRAGLGYAFAQQGQTMQGSTPYSGQLRNYVTPGNILKSNFEIKRASFSAGTVGMAGCGYMITKNVGLQMDANLWISDKKYEYEQAWAPSTYTNNSLQSMQANHMLILTPALVMQTTGEIWKLYCRLGVALPCRTEINESYEENVGTTTTQWTAKIKSSFSIGYTGALGLNYNVSKRVDMWLEACLLSLNLDVSEADYDNVNLALPGAKPTYGPLAVTYLNSGTLSYGSTVRQAYTQPFSNVGVYMGIAWGLGKASRQVQQTGM